MNAPYRAPLTALHVTTEGLCSAEKNNKDGRHVGLDFYDLLIEVLYRTRAPTLRLSPRTFCEGAPKIKNIGYTAAETTC
jgi:hypothetical protein